MTYPYFGALPTSSGARFRVWAPAARTLTLVLQDGPAAGEHPLPAGPEPGLFELDLAGARAGQRYGYRIDGAEVRPDPASRCLPDGVHGLSEIVDPGAFEWTDQGWTGVPAGSLVLYELHVGTFTPEGTFAAAAERLRDLRALGITAIELMPLADFPGERNWGYDGVALFAPSRAYGRPDDLRRFVDTAHGLGLAVAVDVVFNHLGPEGGYLMLFNPGYLTDRHVTPWGRAVNLDGPDSAMVRRFIIDSALHWTREYHVDGLRLDATHALVDHSPRHLLHELAETVRAESDRHVFLHAEDHRNLASLVREQNEDGWGLDGVWADDFHHVIHRMVTGDAHGYYADFDGTTEELSHTLSQGWLYTGQLSRRRGTPRGTDPSAVEMRRFVVCLQNHDQIGNRARGDRLNETVDPAVWRAMSTVLLLAPMTPLLFMGQEWAATTPFLFFTDLEPGLGALVTEGRRREFAAFPDFASPERAARIPDPQARETFESSRLRWDERAEPRHAASLALYTALLGLRHRHAGLAASDARQASAWPAGDDAVVLRRPCEDGGAFWIVAMLQGKGLVESPITDGTQGGGPLETLLTTEESRFTDAAVPLAVTPSPDGWSVRFERPGAIVFRTTPGGVSA